MCGIIGYWGTELRTAREQALSRLAHRGPDDSGTWLRMMSDSHLWFGHRRLAILDLSPLGHQPMIHESSGNVICYNGEIYNFRELRNELELRGYRFRSECDTEVLLHGFTEFGKNYVSKLRGIFAIAFWFEQSRELCLFRDQLGVKPLYYCRTEDGVTFSSECRALRLLSGGAIGGLSREGLSSFVFWGSVHEPYTMSENIRSLEAGTVASWNGIDLKFETYWCPKVLETAEISVEEAKARVFELAEEAVGLQAISDVPLGIFLSGGIDSSAVLALLSRHSSKLRCLTVAFPELGYDESPFAASVASRYGAELSLVSFSTKEVRTALMEAVAVQDLPSIDGVNTWIVSRAARKAGLTVALSGMGGDELFFGYEYYKQLKLLRHPCLRMFASLLSMKPGLREDQRSRIKEIFVAENFSQALPWIRAFWSRRQLEIQNLMPELRALPWPLSKDEGNQYSSFEIQSYLRDTLLRDADVMGMAQSLEIRVPLLDHKLVEYVLGLPSPVKLFDSHTPKPLLVHALGGLLPEDVISRKKSGFSFPFDVWLRDEISEPVYESLRSLSKRGIFARDFPIQQWELFDLGQQHWSRIWQLFVLEQHLCSRSIN